MWYSNKEIILQQYLIHTKTYLTPELDLHTSKLKKKKKKKKKKEKKSEQTERLLRILRKSQIYVLCLYGTEHGAFPDFEIPNAIWIML